MKSQSNNMKLFDVYPLYEVTPVRAKDVYVYDNKGTEYLDLYGGHAVISIGHGHPHYIELVTPTNASDWVLFQCHSKPIATGIGRCDWGNTLCCHDYRLF